MSESNKEYRILSFHGADGSGKSTLARQVQRDINSNSSLIGGSSYLEWLTPIIARETVGSDHSFGAQPRNNSEKRRLYEEIAIACYGYAHHLAEKGDTVIIDSDPVLKRVVWSLVEDGPEAASYIRRFGAFVLDKLQGKSFPTHVIGVNIGDSRGSVAYLQDRLSKRLSNSDYDPKDVEGTLAIAAAVDELWNEIASNRGHVCESDNFLHTVFGHSALISVRNSEMGDSEVEGYLRGLSGNIIEQLNR
jgi:hypothetical protein